MDQGFHVAGFEQQDFLFHVGQQVLTRARQVGLEGVTQVLGALAMQRRPEAVFCASVVRRNMTARTMCFVQTVTLRGQRLVEGLIDRLARQAGIVFCQVGDLLVVQFARVFTHQRLIKALPGTVLVGIQRLFEMDGRHGGDDGDAALPDAKAVFGVFLMISVLVSSLTARSSSSFILLLVVLNFSVLRKILLEWPLGITVAVLQMIFQTQVVGDIL